MPIPFMSISDRYKLSKSILEEEKRCFHPDAPSGCSPAGPIKSHSVSKGTSLAGIAENGHVVSIVKPFDDIIFEDTASVKPSGVKISSIFPGFCQAHDNTLFEPVETEGWTPTKETCFLLSYRSLSNTALKSRVKIRYFEHMNAIDKERARIILEDGFTDEDIMNDYDFGVYAQRYLSYNGLPGRDIEIDDTVRGQYANHAIMRAMIVDFNPYMRMAKRFEQHTAMKQMKEMWIRNNYDNFRFVALKYGYILPFAASKTISVKILSESGEEMSYTNLNVCSNKSESFIIFGWLDDGGTVKDYLDTSIFGDDNKISNKVLRYLLKNPTNFYLKKSWWDGLPERVRDVALAYHSNELNAFPEKMEIVGEYEAIMSEIGPVARFEG